ncbi:hypothetical protein LTR62_003834 [Meristemomyces frigidus]|uniref:Extracellular serine-rich protein n=1 Tax=Meristemomyces frigidus TaxID=1508187 RepID=A0AAN7YGF1_9PEZI|nr:hypothetical protein LTR62_003834 [Meristemomyces frigidus]
MAGLVCHAGAQSSTSSVTTTTAVTSGEVTVHTITVGKVENQFEPNSLVAIPGDIVSFQFYPGNHSVARAQYGFPCVPYEDITGLPGFHSGFQPVNFTLEANTIWNLTINDTSPVFYYCGAPGSCIGWGMLGVINPATDEPLDTQLELAKQANYMIEPGQPLPIDAFNSLSSLAATATQVTLTVTATNSWEPTLTSSAPSSTASAAAAATPTTSSKSTSTLSPGAIAGIAVGAAAVALIAAGLFFMLGRNRSMKEELGRLQHNREQEVQGGRSAPYMTEGSVKHFSNQLPPYQYTPWQEHKPVGMPGMQERYDNSRMSSVPTDNDRYVGYVWSIKYA